MVPVSVRPKKGLGQHFLTEPSVIRQIVDAVQAPAGATVVEIGPGEGAMTGALLSRYPGLIALEIDAEAIAHLRARFPALDLREGDVLDTDWTALREEKAGRRKEGSDGTLRPDAATHALSPMPRPLYVVGNLPYYITAPILLALLDARAHLARAVVMVQKEVADRILAGPGTKAYGTLSVYTALWARRSRVLDVPPQAFRPPPKVDSTVLALDFAGADAPDVDSAALRRVVRAAFGQRRKMLRNSLSGLAAQAGVPVPEWAATRRPEQVSPDDFVRLAHALAPPATPPTP